MPTWRGDGVARERFSGGMTCYSRRLPALVARVLKARHIASGEDRAVKVIDKAVLRKKKTMRRSGSAIAVSSALD